VLNSIELKKIQKNYNVCFPVINESLNIYLAQDVKKYEISFFAIDYDGFGKNKWNKPFCF